MNLKKTKFSFIKKITKKLNSICCFIYSYFYFLYFKNPLTAKIIVRLSFFVLLSAAIGYFIWQDSNKNIIAQGLPSCANLEDSVAAKPGENCLYFGLPSCKDLGAAADPRVNCADIIDLPLCSQIKSSERTGSIDPKPGKNCVKLCSDQSFSDPNPEADPPLERNVDYAVFNKDCIRFCDDMEGGLLKNKDKNCVRRKCHQLKSGVLPTSENCNRLSCNKLTPNELNDPKFDDSTQKYCEGTSLKCYKFTAAQLPFMRLRAQNPTCIIHDCRPENSSCGADDTLNIKNKGSDYISVYEKYINASYNIDSKAVCNRIECKPVVTSQYRCVNTVGVITGDNSVDINRSPQCDTEGPGSKCSNSYCYKTIDCNLSKNATREECAMTKSISQTSGEFEDPYDSWFYRPKPMDKATMLSVDGKSNALRDMDINLCYSTHQMRDIHHWGDEREEDMGFLGTFNLGWFHDYLVMDSRSPGYCDAQRKQVE